jgi:hypothetical protein
MKSFHYRIVRRRSFRFVIAVIFGSMLIGWIGVLWGIARFGSLRTALAYLRGELLVLDASSYDFGAVRPVQRKVIQINASNVSENVVRIIGARSPCGCIKVDGLPIAIGPGDAATISVEIDSARKPGQSIEAMIVFYTDSVEQRYIGAQLHATFGSDGASDGALESRKSNAAAPDSVEETRAAEVQLIVRDKH